MYLIGLTGNIATGKSTVCAVLEELGAEVVDADRLVHELMAPGSPHTEEIARRFGRQVLAANGGVDRVELGKAVWDDPLAMGDLEAILHPAVRKEIWSRLASSGRAIGVVDAIKLIEGGLYREMNAVWVVLATRLEQIRRLIRDRGLSQEEAAKRVDFQTPQLEKLRHATVVIDNSRDVETTRRQVLRYWVAIQARLGGAGQRDTFKVPGR